MGANPKSIKQKCKACGKTKIANRTHTSEFKWRGERNKFRPDCKACERAKEAKRREEYSAQARSAEDQLKDENPLHAFVGGIIKQTRLDWEKYGHLEGQLSRSNTNGSSADRAAASSMAMSLGYLNPREHIIAFMESAHYLDLCDLTGLDPEHIRKRIGVE